MESQESPKKQESHEFSAKTVDEAIKQALESLGLKREEVEINILKKGKGGILGLGAEEARIEVTPKPQPAEVEVSQVAVEILTKLLEAMGIPAKVELVEVEPEVSPPGTKMVALDIKGDDLGVLIGRRGQTLMSLQYLVNLMVSHKTRVRIPIMVDVENYKSRRYEALRSLALRLAEQVKSSRQAVTLEPMPANERRMIHLTLSSSSDVTTHSIGAGESRKVVIAPRNRDATPKDAQSTPGPVSRESQKEENDL